MRLSAMKGAKVAEAEKAAEKVKAAGTAKKKKKARTKALLLSKPPTGRHAQNQPQGIHQTAKAAPSSGNATQAAEEPTTRFANDPPKRCRR